MLHSPTPMDSSNALFPGQIPPEPRSSKFVECILVLYTAYHNIPGFPLSVFNDADMILDLSAFLWRKLMFLYLFTDFFLSF